MWMFVVWHNHGTVLKAQTKAHGKIILRRLRVFMKSRGITRIFSKKKRPVEAGDQVIELHAFV